MAELNLRTGCILLEFRAFKWNIQADIQLHELRAGNTDTARKENKKLLKNPTSYLKEKEA